MAGAFDDLVPQKQAAAGGFDDLIPSSRPLSRTERVLAGAQDPINGGAQLLTHVLPGSVVQAGNDFNNWLADKTGLVARLPAGGVDEQIRQQEADYQSRRGDTGFDGYRVLGNVVSPVNLALAARAPAAATLLGRVGVGAASGAASAALNPVMSPNFWADKAKQVGIGAGFGAAVPLVTGALGRMISPKASTNPNLQLLQQEGVEPTIGQTLGGGWNRAEEKLVSVPFVGDAVGAARGRANEQFNRAALNRALAPIGQQGDEIGQSGVLQASKAIGQAYDDAKSVLGGFRLDPQAAQEINTVQSMVASLPHKEQNQFAGIFGAVQTDIAPNGTILADSFKRIDSKLGREAARFSGSSDAYQQSLGDALTELQKTITANALRANPQAAARIASADKAYANLVRVEGAAKAAMNNSGVFTPAQLNMAVRQADQSVRDRATAQGRALMQDLGNAGQSVLGNRVPNSGTTDRLLQLGAGGALFTNPALTVGGGLGGLLAYTPFAQSVLRGAVTARPQSAQAISNALLKASPSLIPGSAQVGLGLLN